MSHFSVLVIGNNVETQLAPYHEFECTALNDRFVQDIDITDEVREQMTGENPDTLEDALSYHSIEDDRIVDDESKVITGAGRGYENVEDRAPHMWRYAIVKDGQLVKAVKRTNPNKKWDWWEVGGRWSGFLKLKTGLNADIGSDLIGRGRPGLMGSQANDGRGYVDFAPKQAIDFDGMRDEAGRKAGHDWDKAAAAHKGETWEPWAIVGPRTGYDDAAREAYHAQPAVKAVMAALGNPFSGVDQYLTPRDVFVQQARDRAVAPYALVMDGKWLAKGDMGWFGMSDDKVSQDDWNRRVNELLDGLAHDTLITVVDCHI